jgi:hypothetical protein
LVDVLEQDKEEARLKLNQSEGEASHCLSNFILEVKSRATLNADNERLSECLKETEKRMSVLLSELARTEEER